MSNIPLDELEVKLQLLQQIVNIDNKSSTEICRDLKANFNIDCTEADILLIHKPGVVTYIDEALITYRDFI